MDAVTPISPRAEQLLNEYSLGSVRAEYKGHWLKTGLASVVLLPLGFLFLLLVLPTLLSPSFTTGDTWHWLEQLGNLLPALIFGSCSFLLGLFCLIALVGVLWKGEQRVYLGEKGFISARRQVETAVRWEAVQEIRRQVFFAKSKTNGVRDVTSASVYTIIPDEEKQCSIPAEPGPEIEQAVTAYLFPRALESYQAGKTLSFGWLALDNQGLHLTPELASGTKPTALTKLPGIARTSQKLQGLCVASSERFLPWEKLACYWIDETRSALVLSKKGERQHWAIVPLYQVANPTLCLALIEDILYADTRESA
ncbi:MAG: DUF6585 family protein [Ktedonobacteraceae bacterium]